MHSPNPPQEMTMKLIIMVTTEDGTNIDRMRVECVPGEDALLATIKTANIIRTALENVLEVEEDCGE